LSFTLFPPFPQSWPDVSLSFPLSSRLFPLVSRFFFQSPRVFLRPHTFFFNSKVQSSACILFQLSFIFCFIFSPPLHCRNLWNDPPRFSSYCTEKTLLPLFAPCGQMTHAQPFFPPKRVGSFSPRSLLLPLGPLFLLSSFFKLFFFHFLILPPLQKLGLPIRMGPHLLKFRCSSRYFLSPAGARCPVWFF